MRMAIKISCVLGILAFVVPFTALRAAMENDESITIVFKDGHQQHIRMAEISSRKAWRKRRSARAMENGRSSRARPASAGRTAGTT